MSINFVSQETLDEARNKKQEEWKKAFENVDNPPQAIEETPYDPRTLYERLQEQKQKKDDAHAEAIKFGNLVHKLDEDEYDFLTNLESEGEKQKRELKEQEAAALEAFRKGVKSTQEILPTSVLVITDGASASLSSLSSLSTTSSSSSISKSLFDPKTSGTTRKPSAISGLVKRKTATSTTTESTLIEATSTGKRKEQDNDKETDGIALKKSKTEASPSIVVPKKSNALTSLVTYESSSEEDDD